MPSPGGGGRARGPGGGEAGLATSGAGLVVESGWLGESASKRLLLEKLGGLESSGDGDLPGDPGEHRGDWLLDLLFRAVRASGDLERSGDLVILPRL